MVDYSELTASQAKIVNLPPTKNYVITGAPGTGKTVIALHMAKKYAEAGKKVLVLVHNRPLMLFLQCELGEFSEIEIKNIDTWFSHNYSNITGNRIYKFQYDWKKIKEEFSSKGRIYDFIIFDEAQDFLIQQIECMKELATYIACFFDPNQKMNDDALEEDDLLDLLNEDRPYQLLENFRNTKEIFNFAKAYSTKKQPEANKTIGTKPYLVHVSGYDEQNLAILNILKENPGAKTIGVFANWKSIPKTVENIEQNSAFFVDAYSSRFPDLKNPDFSKEGVFVIQYNCTKGLEFDLVILTMCDKIYQMGMEDANTLLYVTATRAKQKLYCIYNSMNCKTDKYIDFFNPIKDTISELSEGILDWKLKPSR